MHVFPDLLAEGCSAGYRTRFAGRPQVSDARAGDRVQGRTRRGRACELVDCTGESIPRDALEGLLADLVAADAFEFRALSKDSATLRLDRPGFGHVQIGERLYRLIVERSCARLEPF